MDEEGGALEEGVAGRGRRGESRRGGKVVIRGSIGERSWSHS